MKITTTIINVAAFAASALALSPPSRDWNPIPRAEAADRPCPNRGNLPLDCPALNSRRETIKLGPVSWQFQPACGTDYNGDRVDILALVTYSFQDCLRACASYNRNRGRVECVALHFEASDIDRVVEQNYGNCWLKNSTGTENRSGSSHDVAAKLVAVWDD